MSTPTNTSSDAAPNEKPSLPSAPVDGSTSPKPSHTPAHTTDNVSHASSPGSMYESPSPPSSDTPPDYVSPPRQRTRPHTKVVPLPPRPHTPISPIRHSHAPHSPVWHSEAQYIPVTSEGTPLVRSVTFTEPHETLRDKYILGCSIIAVTAIVFVIIVSGMTTLLANARFPRLRIESDWEDGGEIPLKYGCLAQGEPISIPLRWTNVPRSASSLVLLFANPGAMIDRGYDPVHWLVTDIPLRDPDVTSLPANASANIALMPKGAHQRKNPHSQAGNYWPPCSPNGSYSLFAIHAYAIDASPIDFDFHDAREVMHRFVGVPVAKLSGRYGLPKGAGPSSPRHPLSSDSHPDNAQGAEQHETDSGWTNHILS